MEDNGNDVGSKLSKKGNGGAGVSAQWAVYNNIPLLRVVPS